MCSSEITTVSVHHIYTMQAKCCFSYISRKNCFMRFKPICICFIWCLNMVPLRVREIFNNNNNDIIIIRIFTQDNPSVHCTVINGVLHIELN